MIISIPVSWNTYYALDTDLWNIALANSCQWEDKNMETRDEYEPIPKCDPYAKDARIKEGFKEDNSRLADRNEGARLSMDAEKPAEDYKIPYHERTASVDYGGSSVKDVCETAEQEKNRLIHKLHESIAYNNHVLLTLHEMVSRTEVHLKKQYYLRDCINQSSMIQMDQIHQLREILK